MSLLQMAGGIAVAGVVAAGSTAFTAGGLTKTWAGGNTIRQNGWLGGSVAVGVTGSATLTAMSITQAPAAVAGVNDVTAVLLTFDANTPSGATVTLTSDGSLTAGTTPAVATGWFCTTVSASQSTCVVGANTTPTTDGYYSGVSSFTVGVS
jgi:hypothetical protein